MTFTEAKTSLRKMVVNIPNVAGVGRRVIGGAESLVVYVKTPLDAAQRRLVPECIGPYRVQVQLAGSIKPLL